MKFFIKCDQCGFKLSQEMKHAVDKGECPSCGAKLDIQNALGVLEFLVTVNELKLPLTGNHLKQIVDAYFKKLPGFETLPEIFIEEEMSDKIRFGRQVQQVQQTQPAQPVLQNKSVSPAQEVQRIEEDVDTTNNTDNTGDISNSTINSEEENIVKKIIKPGDKDHPAIIVDKDGLITQKGGSNAKLTPEEIEEVKRGLGVRPITKPSDPNKGDQFTERVPGLRFITNKKFRELKEEMKAKTPDYYEALEKQAEEEATQLRNDLGSESPIQGPTSEDNTTSSINNILNSGYTEDFEGGRPITLPKLSNPAKGNTILDPSAIIKPKGVHNG